MVRPTVGSAFFADGRQHGHARGGGNRIADKLADTPVPSRQDAHRAADLALSMQRNQVFRSHQALTPQEEQNLNGTAQALFDLASAEYGTASPDAVDFRDRVARLVQAGATSQRAQWEKDAVAGRDAAALREAAASTGRRGRGARGREPPCRGADAAGRRA